jgi:histidine ammonia-lyase
VSGGAHGETPAPPLAPLSPVVLDGGSLTLEALARLARDPRVPVEIAPAALARVERGRARIEALVADYGAAWEAWEKGERRDGERPILEYGVTTGFGEFKTIPIAPSDLEQLQRNLLLSHAAGVGETADPDNPANYFEPDVVRATLAVRLNAFLKGCSGVSVDLLRTVQAMLTRGIVPLVPIRGSVGSSGDLAPLAHLFGVLLGAGRYVVVQEPALARTLRPAEARPAARLAEDLGFPPRQPSFKEALALINGATVSAALLALAVHDGERVAHAADLAAALSLEAMCGCARAFDPRIHAARGHAGQIAAAANVRAQVAGSRLVERAAPLVQDPYSLRCAPAVHGAARDVLAFARRTAEAEINAATDNPLFFDGDGERESVPFDHEFAANWPAGYDGRERISYSACNFHGEPVAVAADALAIGLAEIANIAERRIQMLLDANQNRNLPANLIARRGINSGYMILQYCAAGLVSENKVLTHPASVDSIPTAANAEDHNAMATIAARKARTVLRSAQSVLGLELLTAAQAVEWRVAMQIEPIGPRPQPPASAEEAEAEARAFEAGTAPERRAEIAAQLGAGTRKAYLQVRELALPMLADRPLEKDILALKRALEDGAIG